MWVGLSLSDTEYSTRTPGSTRMAVPICSLAAALKLSNRVGSISSSCHLQDNAQHRCAAQLVDRRLSRGDSNGVATAAAATASAATAVFADKRQTILNMARPFANSHPRRSGATVRIGPAIAEDCKRLLRVALGVARYGPCEFSCRHKPLGRPQAAWSRRGLRDDEILRRRDRNGRGFALGHAADVGQVACGLLLVECVRNRVCAPWIEIGLRGIIEDQHGCDEKAAGKRLERLRFRHQRQHASRTQRRERGWLPQHRIAPTEFPQMMSKRSGITDKVDVSG